MLPLALGTARKLGRASVEQRPERALGRDT